MKKTTRTLLLMVLIISIMSTSVVMAYAVTPRSNAYISSFNNEVSAIGDGKIKIEFETRGTGTMDKIGASTIKVYDQNGWVYSFFMSNPAYTSQLIGTKSTHYYGSVIYQGVEGNTYHATVTHYAAKGSGSGTEDLTSNSAVA